MAEKNQIPLVSIICLTYNHAAYIRECLDGFLMQKTDFPIEVIIHDDASTDGTTDIIREYAEKYPNIIKPIIQTENQYSKHHNFALIISECFKRVSGDYIAFCEGDDYWIDSYKLHAQIEYLEDNPKYGMVYSKVKRFDQESKVIKDTWGGNSENFTELIEKNTIPTPTAVIRKQIIQNYIEDIRPSHRKWEMSDYPLWLYSAVTSKIKFIDRTTSVYRILQQSASHYTNIYGYINFGESFREISYFFAKRYGSEAQKKISHNNLVWIKFVKYCAIRKYTIARKIALKNIFSHQNTKTKNLIFIIGLIKPNIIGSLYNKIKSGNNTIF